MSTTPLGWSPSGKRRRRDQAGRIKVVDIPLDFADWATGPKVGDVAGAPEPVRARIEQAFAENDARAAQRLAGSATTDAQTQMIEKLERLLAEAGVRDIGNVEQFIQDLVSRRSSLQEHVERRWHVEQRGPKRWAIELDKGKVVLVSGTQEQACQEVFQRALADEADRSEIVVEFRITRDRGALRPDARRTTRRAARGR